MSKAFKRPKRSEHVGRKNRLARHRWKIAQELEARGEDRAVFRRLAGHSDESVRAAATGYLNWLDKPRSEPVRRRPLRPEILWQCDHPAPAALAREEIAERLRQSLPEFCDALMDLALPAIGLWPQRRADIAATATRFGGTPSAPPDWQWPIAEEEPLLFVGQINCAELRGLPGAEVLPSAGLLAFFGDHDAVTGCSRSMPAAFISGLTLIVSLEQRRRSTPSRYFLRAHWYHARSRSAASLQPRSRGPRSERRSAAMLFRRMAGRSQSQHSARLCRLCQIQQTFGLAKSGAERFGTI